MTNLDYFTWSIVPCFMLNVISVEAVQAQPISSIEIAWKCVSRQREARYPCANSTQRIRLFKNGRVLLQDRGVLCKNEQRNNRSTYEAFINRGTRGKFLCKNGDFDFEISYSSSVKSKQTEFNYTLKGLLTEKVRAGGVNTGQKLSFTTSVKVEINGSRCYATRSYRFSERFNGVPRVSGAHYNYVSTNCTIS